MTHRFLLGILLLLLCDQRAGCPTGYRGNRRELDFQFG